MTARTSKKNERVVRGNTKVAARVGLPGQVVLALQGGGALGAFQAGVYEAMHEAGIEPDWVVGTSIGAINGAIIAGNRPQQRLARLREFWKLVASGATPYTQMSSFGLEAMYNNITTVMRGIPGFFAPNHRAFFGTDTPLGIEDASFYTTAPLRDTLREMTELALVNKEGMRLTLGAVNATTGRMRYFDSREETLTVEHVMASGALPPAFPAIIIDGAPYWDGGIYSNTPIEVVMDDRKRRDSIVFAAQLWQQERDGVDSIQQVIHRVKDIQYASRAEGHIARQQQIHHLRHIVRELSKLLPKAVRERPEVEELSNFGCGTVMHILELRAPALPSEDHTKDIDFTPAGIDARWKAGLNCARQKIEAAPWATSFDPMMGVVVHD